MTSFCRAFFERSDLMSFFVCKCEYKINKEKFEMKIFIYIS